MVSMLARVVRKMINHFHRSSRGWIFLVDRNSDYAVPSGLVCTPLPMGKAAWIHLTAVDYRDQLSALNDLRGQCPSCQKELLP